MNDLPFQGTAAPETLHLLNVVRQQAGEQAVYLVGGASRDLLSGRSCHDLDFALADDPLQLGRRVARALNADFYVLDEGRATARVVLSSPGGELVFLDFALFRGASLEEDLSGRDFTLNAIAIDLRSPPRLADPLGGLADLRAGILRACSPSAFMDDPIRVLRGVRLSLAFGFKLEKEAWHAMKAAASLLKQVSPERQRDELFNILQGPQVASAMRLLDQAGVMAILLPEISALKSERQGPPHVYDIWEHTLTLLHELELLFSALVKPYAEEKNSNLMTGLAMLKLGRFRDRLAGHFSVHLNPNRSLSGLLYLAALLHDSAKPGARAIDTRGHMHFIGHEREGALLAGRRAQALALSQVEAQRLQSIVGGHMRIHMLAMSETSPSRRAIYRFFQAAGPAGVDLILLSLADTRATYGLTLPQETWIRELDVCCTLLEAWWDRPQEIVSPPRLVDGHDLLEKFKMKPGPQVGALLAAIQEAQAAGEIDDRSQALAFAGTWLQSNQAGG